MNTHKLVSLEELDRIQATHAQDTFDKLVWYAELLKDSPEVDLSEEGIRTKAAKIIEEDDEHYDKTDNHFVYSRAGAQLMYELCAKDLLKSFKPKEGCVNMDGRWVDRNLEEPFE